MKSKITVVIMSIVMLVSLLGIVGTVYYAKDHIFQADSSFAQQTPADISDNGNETQPPQNGDAQNTGTAPAEPPQSQQEPKFNGENFSADKTSQNGFDHADDMRGFQLNAVYIAVIAVFSALFSLSLIYLIMTAKNRTVFKNTDKIIIFILASVLLCTYLTAGVTVYSNRFVLKNNQLNMEQTAEKDKVSLNEDNIVNSNVVDLSDCTEDVAITDGGTYEFSGNFTKSIVVNSPNEDVEIILNNTEISNNQTAAIIGLSAKSLTVNLKDNTENILSDGGNSEYDGCIFSNAPLVFTGNGTLTVNGNQNEGEGIATEAADITINSGKIIITSADDGINAGGNGAQITINGGDIYINASGDGIDSNKNAVINGGTLFVLGSDVGGDAVIDTDEGYIINGGTVVALGSDMIEVPEAQSTQNTLAFTLDNKIDKDICVTLMKGDEQIVSFTAPKSFRTIIISGNLSDGNDYRLYTGSTNGDYYGIYSDDTAVNQNTVSVNSQDVFAVTQSVNQYGRGR